jgi:bacterioferritin (cytochrome b1)
MTVGLGSAAVSYIFEKIAVEEMKHAEKLADRLS